MSKDKDIQDLFKEKNREILITNLKFDLDKNISSLLETTTNIFNLEFETAIKKIVAIMNDAGISDSDKFVADTINAMKDSNYKDIEMLFNAKKDVLVDSIDNLEFTDIGINKYYEVVFTSTKFLKDKLEMVFKEIRNIDCKVIQDFISKNIKNDKEELTVLRIDEYIDNRLYGKLNTKIHMEIMLRDNNLINKAKEVYGRYQDIFSKTE